MKLWPFFPILLLASQCALHGQGMDTLHEKGDDALASGLWEVAELRFRECLADPALAQDEKPRIAMRLAESLIRAGKTVDALELLNLSFVAKDPELPFWKAQATAAAGRFAEAVGIFSQLLRDPKAPYREEAAFSLASLQQALGKPTEALETLSALTHDSPPETTTQAALRAVEILLDQDRPDDARKMMPERDRLTPGDRPLAAFLEANLLLGEHHFPEAAAAFQSLLSQPRGQTLERYHSAAIGLADAIRAQGDQEGAAKSLLNFIQEHPDSPILEAMFRRLQQWLPESPDATDPILEQLKEWITPPEFQPFGAITSSQADEESAAAAAWPHESRTSDLLAFSLFTRALGLHRLGTPQAREDARFLMTRLLLENAGHFLANRAIYQTARWMLDDGDTGRAFARLNILGDSAVSPVLRGEAAFLEARSAYQKGDTRLAIRLFDEAATTLNDGAAESAKLNAGIARLRSGDLKGVTLIQQTAAPKDPELEADLELERALSIVAPVDARKAIEDFINRHPDHARTPEARLAAAESALTGPAPDLAFARAQLDALDALPPEKTAALPPAKIALTRLRIADLSPDAAAAIPLARSILETYPTDPAAEDAALTLGRNLFESKDYNDARMVLERLASKAADPARAQAAWLLAARSAALVPTPSSKEGAVGLFDNAIALKGPLESIARLEKADHLIKNLYRFADAATMLRTWFDTLPKTDPLRLPAGLLLAQALYAQGGTSPNSLVQALEIYDQLLPFAEKHPALIHRLQYLRGLALEQLPDPKDPSKKRESQAFVAYYSVLESNTPPIEWEYFELCGFKALSLLEKAERWPAAIACAEKIASFKGPRAEEAATRANQIQLKHMIW
jgi:tetratricopeptide (TPR) repeat protein